MSEQKSRPTFYLIPGMGCDETVFQNLRNEGIEFEIIEHLRPRRMERFSRYVKRLSAQIDTSKPFILGGVSFGGVTAMEMSRYVKPEQLIVISSIKTAKEFPWYLKLFRVIPVHQILPAKACRRMMKRSFIKHPAKLGSQKALNHRLKMLDRIPPYTIKWQLNRVIRWKRWKMTPNVPVVHIHGENDTLFPPRFIKNPKLVPGANHFMVVTQASKVAQYIRNEIA